MSNWDRARTEESKYFSAETPKLSSRDGDLGRNPLSSAGPGVAFATVNIPPSP